MVICSVYVNLCIITVVDSVGLLHVWCGFSRLWNTGGTHYSTFSQTDWWVASYVNS